MIEGNENLLDAADGVSGMLSELNDSLKDLETAMEVGKPEYPTNTAVYTTQGWCYYVTTPADDIWTIITDILDADTKFIRFNVRGADASTVIININQIVSIIDLTPAEDAE